MQGREQADGAHLSLVELPNIVKCRIDVPGSLVIDRHERRVKWCRQDMLPAGVIDLRTSVKVLDIPPERRIALCPDSADDGLDPADHVLRGRKWPLQQCIPAFLVGALQAEFERDNLSFRRGGAIDESRLGL